MGVARRFARRPAGRGSSSSSPPARRSRSQGAKAFDRGALRADFGFVFDHASPIGELIVAAPTYFRIEAEFHGRAAHAGHPARGRPQRDRGRGGRARGGCELGRIDDETTANVGPDRRRHGRERGGRALPARARGAQPRPRQGDATRSSAMVDALTEAGERRRVRRRDARRGAVPRLPDPADRAARWRPRPRALEALGHRAAST